VAPAANGNPQEEQEIGSGTSSGIISPLPYSSQDESSRVVAAAEAAAALNFNAQSFVPTFHQQQPQQQQR
jgi:hypothetical protein